METKFAEIPDALWDQIEPLLPALPDGPRRGRPPIPNRTILSGIVYRLRTGSQWKALPDQFSSGSTCHARFQAWSKAGIFRRLFEKLVQFYDDVRGIEWEWASLDSAIVKAPKGGDATGPNPTDRRASSATFSPMAEVFRWRPRSRAPTFTTNVPRSRRSMLSSCERLVVHGARRICAPTRGTILTTLIARFEHVEYGHTFGAVARSQGNVNVGERDGGSWSTTGFAPCSFAGSERVPTTWHCSISRAP